MSKSIDILLSPNCNLSCRYCYQRKDVPDNASSKDFHKQKGAAASIELIDKFISFVVQNEVRMVNFYGGEPLLQWPYIEYIVNEISKRNKDARFMTVTNGTLFDENKLNFIEGHNFNIILSLDGAKSRHDKFRGGFTNIQRYLSRLSSLGSRVEVNIQVAEVSGLYEEAIRYVWSQGLRVVNLNLIEDYGWYQCDDLKAFEEEYEKALEGMLREDGIVKDSLKIYADLKEPSFKKQCGITDRGLAMDWHGDFYPCLKGYELGKEYSIGNIDSGVNVEREETARSRAGVGYTSESSQSHPLVAYCPVETFKKHGTFDGLWNEYFCKMMEIKTKLVAKLYYEIHGYLLKHKGCPYLNDWTEE